MFFFSCGSCYPVLILAPCTGNERDALVQGVQFCREEGTASIMSPTAALQHVLIGDKS